MNPSKMRHTRLLVTALVLVALVGVTVVAVLFGSSAVSLQELVALATGAPVSESAKNILLNVRFPRVAAALLAGAALAVAGALIQAVLDNPLAGPNVIGINSGAGLAVLMMASFFPGLLFLQPLAAFAGALLTAFLIFCLSLGAGTSKLTVVLAGIALSTIFGAGMNTVLIMNPDAYIRSANFLVGGLSGVLAQSLVWPGAYIAAGLVLACLFTGKLNIMSLGDATAHALGMGVHRWRMGILGLAALLAGAAVSFAGILGFVGLIVPHVVRFLVGHDNRVVVPLSAAFGAAFVVCCDLCARVLFAPYEVPVGILMAFIGGPFFIYLIVKNKQVGNV
ncbi:MAG: iron ABC transporter permease [Coriobacteriaceae bacterium]|jgi:iron complex transport system permease protein|nr:iron ABC transporter permease [Coriobacteriaceae bacterium]